MAGITPSVRSAGSGGEAIGVLVVDADLNEIPSYRTAGIDADRLGRKRRQHRGVLLAPMAGTRMGVGWVEASDDLHDRRLGQAC